MTTKNCPLLFEEGYQKACVKENCAWWDEDSQKCAMLVLALNSKKE